MYDLLPTSLLAAGFLGPIAEAVGPFLAPALTVILTVAGVLWNHEKRIRDLEENKRRRGRTMYGDENDPQYTGIVNDIRELKDTVEEIRDHQVNTKNT